MSSNYRLLKNVRWISLPLGALMFLGTFRSFGIIVASILGIAAAFSFYLITRKEFRRVAQESLTKTIKDAIAQTGDVDSVVEFRTLRSGFIVRIYLIDCKDHVNEIHNRILSSIDRSSFKNTLAIMQLTELSARKFIDSAREVLNEQLIEELKRQVEKGD